MDIAEQLPLISLRREVSQLQYLQDSFTPWALES